MEAAPLLQLPGLIRPLGSLQVYGEATRAETGKMLWDLWALGLSLGPLGQGRQLVPPTQKYARFVAMHISAGSLKGYIWSSLNITSPALLKDPPIRWLQVSPACGPHHPGSPKTITARAPFAQPVSGRAALQHGLMHPCVHPPLAELKSDSHHALRFTRCSPIDGTYLAQKVKGTELSGWQPQFMPTYHGDKRPPLGQNQG